MFSSMKDGTKVVTNGGTDQANYFVNPLDEIVGHETKGAENFVMNYVHGYLSEYLSLDCQFAGIPYDDTVKERFAAVPVFVIVLSTCLGGSRSLVFVFGSYESLCPFYFAG